MSSLYDNAKARPLAKGFQCPGGSVKDPDLVARFRGYKRSIAGRYRAINSEEIDTRSPYGPVLCSPKIDGELWYMVFDEGDVFLTNPAGRVVYGDIPVLDEARKAMSRIQGRTILAGEFFAIRKGGRPRHDDLALAMGGEAKADMARVGYMAFDLLEGGDAEGQAPLEDYKERLEVMRRVFAGGKRLQAIKTEEVEGPEAIRAKYEELVASGKAEGLVLRRADGTIYKLKPIFTLDAVVVGYTERVEEPGRVRSMALAMMREDGSFHIIGSCGNMNSETRESLFPKLKELETTSAFRHASNDGALYRFIEPKLIIEVKVTDVLGEHPSGDPILRMVAAHEAGKGWAPVRRMPSVSILHPIFQRIRTDKEVNATDVRIGQVLERCPVPDLAVKAEKVELPPSEVMRREVYTKTTKGKLAVRKLVVWKTNKEELDPSYPAFVVHFTDYSPGRKDPLKREVRLAPRFDVAEAIAEDMLVKNIKKGWAPA